MQRSVFIILLFTYLTAATQTEQIENLVFEGAGIRGIAYSGAIKVLESHNLLPGVKRIGGTSAGAITAMMLALGYTSGEITNIISDTRFAHFNSGRFSVVGGLHRLQKHFGWYRSKRVGEWLSRLIKEKAGDPDFTFAQLRERGFKDLYITGTCLNKQQPVVFSYQHFPHMKVKDAVRISMSIPLYFEAVFMDSLGNVINRPRQKKGLDIMVDGGFTSNFPIHMFDSIIYTDDHFVTRHITNNKTLGFRIDHEQQIKWDRDSTGLAPMPINNIKEYAAAFYNIVIENLNRQNLTKQDWQRTISISDGSIQPRIRKLSAAEMDTLITNGYTATEKYFTRVH